MSGKEKIKKIFNHQEGEIPIDFGASAVTGMHVSVVAALRKHYGLGENPVKVIEPYQMLGLVDEDLKQILGIDVDGIWAPKTMFGFTAESWKEWTTPWNQQVLVPEEFNTTPEPGGDILIYPEGDTSAPPSGRMPGNGYFFDTIIRQESFNEDDLDPEDNLEEFGRIGENDLDYYRNFTGSYAENQRAILANFGGTGLGDIALVPAPGMKYPKGIRDITEWYISTVSRREYLHEIFARQTDIALYNLEKIYTAIGDSIDAVFICGTDFGTQSSSFCSPETFDTLYAPYYRKMNDWIHSNTGWKTFKHSCGAVESFMSHFIDAGFDIINPVQVSASGMDPVVLKEKYGADLVFWGGGIDTQKTLPFGTPEDVREEVLSRCEVLGKNGGFVFNAVHNVQAKTPVNNLIAMFEAVREYNGSSNFR
ncbi:MAG: uroporphyrinogen decarboxylase family protein [Spirochaetia bacterium]